MKKVSMLLLTAVMMSCLTTLVSAVDVKINGKVDVRQEFGGLSTVDPATGKYDETGYNVKELNLREVRLTAKATINEKISAQISNNFAGSNNLLKDPTPASIIWNTETSKYDTTYNFAYAGIEANNTGFGDTYININVLGGSLLFGQTTIPGFAIRETILNEKLGYNLTRNNITQLCYAGKMEPVSYVIAVVDGNADTTGAGTKDAIVNISGKINNFTLGGTYNFDSNDDDGKKGSFFALNAGVAISMFDVKLQYIGGLNRSVTGENIGTVANPDYRDVADDSATNPAKAPTSELVADIGLKIGDKHNLSVGYDMFGKSDAIIVKGSCKVANGVSAILRADMLGSKLKKVIPTANNISLGVVAEF